MQVVDYSKYPKMHEYLADQHSNKPFDAIIDIAGGCPQLYTHCPLYLTEAGIFLFAGDIKMSHDSDSFLDQVLWLLRVIFRKHQPIIFGGVPRSCANYSGGVNKGDLETFGELLRGGFVKAVIDSVWKMEDLAKAYEHVLTGRAKGKVVLHVQD